MLAGPDVSSNNGVVSWAHLHLEGEGELAFAIAKATEGATWDDPLFGQNWHGIRARGLYRGAYHFARPGTPGTPTPSAVRAAATAEAEHLLSVLHRVGGIGPGDLPPILDLEVSRGLTASELQLWIQTWVHVVHEHVGRAPIIYTGGFWKGMLTGVPDAWGCPLWLAQYGPHAQVPHPWRAWTLWQFTDAGRVAGVSGNVDLSWFHGSRKDLEKLCGGAIGSHTHRDPPAPHPAPPTPAHHPVPGHHTSTVPPPPTPTAPPHFAGRTLEYGVRGTDVRTWQLRMHERGFVHMRTDGIFDATCSEGCRWLQLYLRLPATERVDERLWRATWTTP